MTLKESTPVLALLFLLSTQNVLACDREFFDECLDGVGPAVTNSDSLKTSTFRISNGIHQRSDEGDNLASADSETGLSSGELFTGWSIWAAYNRSKFDADLPLVNALDANGSSVAVASYDADLDGFTIGADTLLSSKFLLGLAIGYEQSDILTDYNGGDNESDGFTFAPYAAYLISSNFSVDLAAGYSTLDYNTDRIDNSNGNILRGSFDSDRWFIASNLNATFNYQNWFLGGRLGYLHTEERQDAYFETGGPRARTIKERRVELSQLLLSIDASYSLGSFEPYAIVTYLNDLNREEGEEAGGLPGGVSATISDDDEIQYGLGVRLFSNSISGSLEWNKTVGRADFNGDAVMLTLRADF